MDNDVKITSDELRMFDTVDTTVHKAVVSGNPLLITELADELIRGGQIRGLALAKLFWSMQSNWKIFEAAGIEDDWITFLEVHTGRSRQTITKYASMWERVFANTDISEEYKRELAGKDLNSLMRLASLAGEGIEEETLKKVIEATNSTEAKDIIKKERGEATSSKTALLIFYQLREGGQLPPGTLFIRDNGKPVIIGTLDHGSGDAQVEKAINRILNGAHVREIV